MTDLAASIGAIARAFHPRPVVYRAADLRSNEFRGLAGGEDFEPLEDNPMIGYRGCYRYVHDPSFFRLELAALARVREESPGLALMIPFVRTRWELEACLAARRRLARWAASGGCAAGEVWILHVGCRQGAMNTAPDGTVANTVTVQARCVAVNGVPGCVSGTTVADTAVNRVAGTGDRMIRIKKAINAVDPLHPSPAEEADSPTGPVLAVGSPSRGRTASRPRARRR